MQYVRSIPGSVSKAWNSINPATLSGAIDVIVVEHEDGSLACSPFHVRFGKFSLLRPYEKKVEFRVNDVKQDYSMKLGEGGEAFFVFETSAAVPENLQTSPLVSPAASPDTRPVSPPLDAPIPELDPLDLDGKPGIRHAATTSISGAIAVPAGSPDLNSSNFSLSQSFPEQGYSELSESWANGARPVSQGNMFSTLTEPQRPASSATPESQQLHGLQEQIDSRSIQTDTTRIARPNSPPSLPRDEAVNRAMQLSKRLLSSNIPSHVNDEGDLMLDMTGYKTSEEEALRAELVARQILSDELEGNYDIGSLIGADEKGNLWIYSSEEAKEAAAKRAAYPMMTATGMVSADALSDPGYHSDETQSQKSFDIKAHERQDSNDSVGLNTPPDSPAPNLVEEPSKNYAKTLRLTSDQLKALNLRPGPNPMSFSVNRATCPAYMYLWKHDAPIVISDIDGTITKSDALGHVLNMIGRDWTHSGVAKLYADIVANGYNILYLTSRSVGQADTTRTYIGGIVQEGYKLPKGPVIMSPDRTIAALRREIYLRKPEVFKMACLRDIKSLFHTRGSPFYAGFGNRLTDALSYRSVNIPSTRIFTINSNSEVSLDLLSLNKYRTGYTSMREIVDYFFPPVGTLVQEGAEEYTDFNYWRDAPRELDEISMTSSERDGDFDDEEEEDDDDDSEEVSDDDDVLSDGMAESYMSTARESLEESMSSLVRRGLEYEGRSVTELVEEDEEILVPVDSTDGLLTEQMEVSKVDPNADDSMEE